MIYIRSVIAALLIPFDVRNTLVFAADILVPYFTIKTVSFINLSM